MKKFGFSKTLRLQTPSEFQAVFLQPIRSRSRFFTVLATPNGKTYARLGIIVAKRNIKRAIDRNRARRLIRESFRQEQEDLKGLDIIVLVRSEILEENQTLERKKRLKKQWQELIKR